MIQDKFLLAIQCGLHSLLFSGSAIHTNNKKFALGTKIIICKKENSLNWKKITAGMNI